jgi:hypothetical protein
VEYWSAVLDALKDSSITFGVVFLVYFILSFCETWLSEKLVRSRRMSPLFGSIFGLVPQCGASVVAADLYLKDRISVGTLIAVFIACSDEALPIIASSPAKGIMALPLIGLKFVLALAVGYLVDLIIRPKAVPEEEKDVPDKVHIGCCGHEIDDEEENKWHKHLFHPLIHSLKIFAYVFIINVIFNILITYVGEDNMAAFISQNKYLAPLYSVLVGLIPNCASSVVISELFIRGQLSFGAALGGLIVNAGLGFTVLFRDRKYLKKTFAILGVLMFVGLAAGYITCLIMGF